MKKSKTQNGITLIALIITIIVMIILVAVTVTIAINGGLFGMAKNASQKTQMEADRETLLGAILGAYDTEKGKVDFDKLDEGLTDWEVIIGEPTPGEDQDEGKKQAECTSPNENTFIVDEDGNIEEFGKIDTKKDENPGQLEGEGTESNPYKINSIEDLVAFSYNVNSGEETYEGKVVTLGRSLFFNGLFNSYVDENAKYQPTGSGTLAGYIPNEHTTMTIKNLVTTDMGFIPVGMVSGNNTFKGTFDGKGNYLYGIYIDGTKSGNFAGFFGCITTETKISNLGIKGGTIKGREATGGIVGQSTANISIENCYNTAEISGYNYTGGIIGQVAGETKINNCYNTGNIPNAPYAGGMIGQATNEVRIDNCYNTGNIAGPNYSGGIIGNATFGATINDSYNTGIVKGSTNAGGIVGHVSKQANMNNCYNVGLINSNSNAGGTIGLLEGTATIDSCYNKGNISGSSRMGGIVSSISGMGTVVNSYNEGKLKGNASYSGGIIGEINRLCYSGKLS